MSLDNATLSHSVSKETLSLKGEAMSLNWNTLLDGGVIFTSVGNVHVNEESVENLSLGEGTLPTDGEEITLTLVEKPRIEVRNNSSVSQSIIALGEGSVEDIALDRDDKPLTNEVSPPETENVIMVTENVSSSGFVVEYFEEPLPTLVMLNNETNTDKNGKSNNWPESTTEVEHSGCQNTLLESENHKENFASLESDTSKKNQSSASELHVVIFSDAENKLNARHDDDNNESQFHECRQVFYNSSVDTQFPVTVFLTESERDIKQSSLGGKRNNVKSIMPSIVYEHSYAKETGIIKPAEPVVIRIPCEHCNTKNITDLPLTSSKICIIDDPQLSDKSSIQRGSFQELPGLQTDSTVWISKAQGQHKAVLSRNDGKYISAQKKKMNERIVKRLLYEHNYGLDPGGTHTPKKSPKSNSSVADPNMESLHICNVCEQSFVGNQWYAHSEKQCEDCGLCFAEKELLLIHMENFCPCRKCIIDFQEEEEYTQHLCAYHHCVRHGFVCPFCLEIYPHSQVSDFKTHLVNMHGKNPLMCVHCSEKLNTCKELILHLRKVHDRYIPRRQTCCTAVTRYFRQIKATEQSDDGKTYIKLLEGKNVWRPHRPITCVPCGWLLWSCNVPLSKVNYNIDRKLRLKGHVCRILKNIKKFVKIAMTRTSWDVPRKSGFQMNLAKRKPRKVKQCHICGKWIFKLSRHMETHGKIRFGCLHCPKNFSCRAGLTNHIRLCHAPIAECLICEICGFIARTSFLLKEHMKRHTGNKPVKCDICGKSFYDNRGLSSHKKFVHSKRTCLKQLACDICAYKTNKQDRYDLHMECHGTGTPVVCNFCGKSYPGELNLRQHIQRIHEPKKKNREHPCPNCNKSFSRRSYLRAHQAKHLPDNSFTANYCEETVTYFTSIIQTN